MAAIPSPFGLRKESVFIKLATMHGLSVRVYAEPCEIHERLKEVHRMGERTGENVVLIGKKPVMNYVVACMTLFNSGVKQVKIKARGRAIPTAVNTVELIRRAFIKNLVIPEGGINIGTEELTGQDGRRANVSTIEITVAKP